MPMFSWVKSMFSRGGGSSEEEAAKAADLDNSRHGGSIGKTATPAPEVPKDVDDEKAPAAAEEPKKKWFKCGDCGPCGHQILCAAWTLTVLMVFAHFIATIATHKHLRDLVADIEQWTTIFCEGEDGVLVAERDFVVDIETLTGLMFGTLWTPIVLTAFFIAATLRLWVIKVNDRDAKFATITAEKGWTEVWMALLFMGLAVLHSARTLRGYDSAMQFWEGGVGRDFEVLCGDGGGTTDPVFVRSDLELEIAPLGSSAADLLAPGTVEDPAMAPMAPGPAGPAFAPSPHDDIYYFEYGGEERAAIFSPVLAWSEKDTEWAYASIVIGYVLAAWFGLMFLLVGPLNKGKEWLKVKW